MKPLLRKISAVSLSAISLSFAVSTANASAAEPTGSSSILQSIKYQACLANASRPPLINPPATGNHISPQELCKELLK